MRQLLTIAWKDTYLRFTDSTQLVIMLLAPLLLSTIIGLAFGGTSGGQGTFQEIPIAIVNQDTGSSNTQVGNLGQIFTTIFIPDESAPLPASPEQCGAEDTTTTSNQLTLDSLFNAVALDDVATARAGVDDGTYVAAIIIPPDFSAKMTPNITQDKATIAGTQVEVYASDGSPIQASIVHSVTTSILNQFVTGNVTVAVTVNELINRAQQGRIALAAAMLLGNATNSADLNFACAFVPSTGLVSISQQPLDAVQQTSAFVVILVVIGSAQAAYFALFTGQFGILSLFEEKDNGTLQRMMVTPTTRTAIIFGKVAGVLLSVLLQIALLLLAFTLVASLVEGRWLFIWGNNLPLLALLVFMTVLSISGVGILIAGLSSSPEQARMVGPLINVGLGAMAGAFGFTIPPFIARLSPLYWAVNGYQTLAGGNTTIGIHLLALLLFGLVTTAIGLFLFNRKVEL